MNILYICATMREELNPAAKIAQYLLEIKAIKLSPQQPFKWASGWNSPIYCDNRVSLSYPEIRTFIKYALAREILKRYPNVQAIVGVATAGIAQAALVADYLALPMAYVRPEPKSHGRQNQLEGDLPLGAKIVVLEDLISTGGSSLKAVEVLRNMGYEVIGLAAIFTYGFEIASKHFTEAACPFFTLCNYEVLIQKAVEMGAVSETELERLSEWRLDPAAWS